ncbi:CbtA family protein [Haloferax sp. S1W]|uniref:CbtA family protein n=1 Tax=Haloferax sp. S1W TaxID=3377110 RepID=UPI0037C533FE
MLAAHLTRGVKAGIAAGLVFGLFMALVANPLVVYADEMNHAAAEAGHSESGTPWEWAGSYHLEPGTYTYTFQEGPDPAMHLAVLRSDHAGQESIHQTEGTAAALYESHDSAVAVENGGSLGAAQDTLYDLRFAESGATTFTLEVEEEGHYVLFTEHVPSEFDAALTSESGAVVEPDVTEGAGAHAHEEEGGHAHEEGGHAGEGDDHHDTAVSMAVNKTVSVISSGLWAILLGGVFFGIAFYFLEPAIPGTGAAKSYAMGLAGFVTVSGAPWMVLPPVTPGAQQSLPTDTRLLLYGGMMVVGALVCLLSGYVYNRVSESNGRTVAVVAAVLPFGLLAIPAAVAPTNVVTDALSPELRTGLLGLFVFGQVLVWLLLAATHAQLRSIDSQTDTQNAGHGSTVMAD